jgi:hypothetical protein
LIKFIGGGKRCGRGIIDTCDILFSLYVFLQPAVYVGPHRGQPSTKCHPRWQPTRRLAVSCGLGRCWIRTRDCRTTVWCATTEPPHLPRPAIMLQYTSIWITLICSLPTPLYVLLRASLMLRVRLFKGTVTPDFYLRFFPSEIPTWAPDSHPKIFSSFATA